MTMKSNDTSHKQLSCQWCYGTEVLPLAQHHVDQLRPAIANACLGDSQGRNSTIALSCMPHMDDPEVILLTRTLRILRRFAARLPVADQELFFYTTSRSTGTFADCRGPAGVFRFYLQRWDIQCDAQGYLTFGPFLRLSLLGTSFQQLRRLVRQLWRDRVLVESCDCKSETSPP